MRDNDATLKMRLSKALSKDLRNNFKFLIWRAGMGSLFKAVVGRKRAFESVFKRMPNSIMVFPTNLCNALCSFCAYPTNTDKKQMMANDTAFKAIDDFIAMGGGNVVDFTTNLGDPLVDPRLADKLAYAKAKGVKRTRFYTNGILLDRDGLIEKVMPNLDRLHISLPGLDRKNYFEVFKVDKAEKLLRGLLKLAEYKKATGSPKEVLLEFRINRPLDVVMQDDGMQKLKPYIEQGIFSFGVTIENYENWGGAVTKENMSGSMTLRESRTLDHSVPCQLLFYNPGILPDGHVRACSCWYVNTNYDKLTLEKVTDKPLSDILFGDGHRAIISDWIKGDLPPPCPKCSNYEPVFFSLKDTVRMASALFS